jgi:hypothetical protein
MKDNTQNVVALKGLKANRYGPNFYLFFCLNEQEMINFVSQNSYLQKKFKFVMVTGTPTFSELQDLYKFKVKFSKIAFTDSYMAFYKEEYINSIEFEWHLANGIPIPERLFPSSLRELIDDSNL